MDEKWNPEDIAILVRGRKILKAKGLPKDADVKKIFRAIKKETERIEKLFSSGDAQEFTL